MIDYHHLVKESSNKKLGKGVAASTSSSSTCPSLCPFKLDGSCYGMKGPQSWNWAKVSRGERGSNWWSFCSDVLKLKKYKLFRLNVTGDIPQNIDGIINEVKLRTLISSCELAQIKGWTYTHTHLLNDKNLDIIKSNKSKNLTINLSTEDRYQAAEYQQAGYQVSIVDNELFNLSANGYEVKVGSTKFTACPEQLPGSKVTCSTCRKCVSNADNREVIIFHKH